MKYMILTCILLLLSMQNMQADGMIPEKEKDEAMQVETILPMASLNCLYVYFSPNAVLCGTSEISAEVNCNFTGTISMNVIGNPPNIVIPNGDISVVNGVFSFEIEVLEGAPSFIDIITNVVSIGSDPNNCVITQTCEPSTLVTACSIPENNDCENALELNVGLDNCDLFNYSSTLWSASGMDGSCSDVGDEDVFFVFEATNEVANLEFGELPSNSMTMELYTSCSGGELYCASIGSYATVYLNDLEVGESYLIRISDLQGDNEGIFEMCLWSPLICDLGAIVSLVQNEICIDQCNGIALAEATGGTAPYTFIWENGDTIETSESLCEGIHSVSITDVNGCFAETTIEIAAGNQVVANAGIDSRICFGDSLQLQASGGNSYRWTPSLNLSDANIANPIASPSDSILYTVSVVDELGCKDSDSILIAVTQNPQPVISGDSLFCFNGSTVLSVDSVYQEFLWNTQDSSNHITIDSAMMYKVLVMDSLGCQGKDSLNVEKYSEILADFEVGHESGYHFENGSISTTVEGGMAPYSYLWSTGDSLTSLQNLPPGNYYINITDSVNCFIEHHIPIDTFFCPAISMEYESSNVSCFGECDGRIQITNIENTQGTVQYSWSNGINSSEIIDLCTGSYQVDIIDSLNCSLNASFFLDEPDEIIIEIDDIVHARVGLPGSIDITTNGSYTYEWTGSDGYHSMEEDIDELEIGCYTLTVKDLLTNCTRDTTICIEDLTSISSFPNKNAAILIYPNPAKDILLIDLSGSEIKEASLKIADVNGTILWSKIKAAETNRLIVNTSQFIPAFYFLIVNDGNQIYHRRIIIRE